MHYCTDPDVTWAKLGEWYGLPPNCALLSGFATTARVAFLRQHNVRTYWMGPASYVVTGDLSVVTPGNEMCKFADDAYLIVTLQQSNMHSCMSEIENIEPWSRKNNMTLNRKKSRETVLSDCSL